MEYSLLWHFVGFKLQIQAPDSNLLNLLPKESSWEEKRAVGKKRQISGGEKRASWASQAWAGAQAGGQCFTPVSPWQIVCPTTVRALPHGAKNTHSPAFRDMETRTSCEAVVGPHYSTPTSAIRPQVLTCVRYKKVAAALPIVPKSPARVSLVPTLTRNKQERTF